MAAVILLPRFFSVPNLKACPILRLRKMKDTGIFPFLWSALSRATVFDLPYKVIVYGTEYTADRLANIKLSRSLDGKGFNGVSTTCFSCDIYTETVFSEGASVIFDGYLLPTWE